MLLYNVYMYLLITCEQNSPLHYNMQLPDNFAANRCLIATILGLLLRKFEQGDPEVASLRTRPLGRGFKLRMWAISSSPCSKGTTPRMLGCSPMWLGCILCAIRRNEYLPAALGTRVQGSARITGHLTAHAPHLKQTIAGGPSISSAASECPLRSTRAFARPLQ